MPSISRIIDVIIVGQQGAVEQAYPRDIEIRAGKDSQDKAMHWAVYAFTPDWPSRGMPHHAARVLPVLGL